MGRMLLVLAAVGALAACAQERTTVSAPPPGISYRFEGDNIASANQRAYEYCQQYGKRARLQTVNQSGSDHIAIYACS
ncbi:MAG TPA: hypothetical protein VN668_04585 [Stellaceae bacterium]|nr:hypothetical protein [Stellaceae bacterium]